ncbi:hypothetical protein B0J11DRAFT_551833 [Dendryphion nanum]|uniref:Uncharacterized protein n=1 Tax=Dendryphion nanum TaxID=256645 RepID=A0A9P9DIA5_9PLEO|nr:hypothetical protein B0J11DRAFT_551833 [Dendryphion nanum]
MPESTQEATPRSNSTSEISLLKAPKDKNCPFCGQSFTSSSLGRHLDLYIRPKNPKPPDNVHLVDEIRKIRGGITRRHAKSAKRGSSTPVPKGGNDDRVDDGDASPVIVQSPTEDEDSLLLVSRKIRQPFSDVSWQSAAGTPSGKPPQRALAAKTPEVRRDVSRMMQKADLEQRQKVVDEGDTAAATEMALRELLKSVREANAKASGPSLFDFDPYTLNFPGLCLHILPAPSTLFSPSPFPTNESWSISPPGQVQFDSLNRHVRERLIALQRQRQINQMYPNNPHSNPSSTNNSPLPTPPLFEPDPQRLFGHIADAYQHWSTQTDKHRQEIWQLEILRSYARANDLRREAEISLENARREIEYLKANRWSSGASELSPVIFNIAPDTVKEVGKLGMDFRNWDYDRLIDKWRNIVREGKSTAKGMAAQKPLPATTRSCSMISMPVQSFSVNTTTADLKMPPMPYSSAPPTTIGTEPGSDQIDAEGEDDDVEVDIDADAASDDGSMHHQAHALPLEPTPLHPPQMSAHALAQANAHFAQAQAQAQAQAHAQAQAQAQAQAWAAARHHMNQSRNQHHHPHQQMSPHPQHMGSANNSRRGSHAFMDTHGMNTGAMLPMEGIENHQDQFLPMGMGLPDGFVATNADGV